MKLILVRHGESARNRGYQVADADNNLTAEGVRQAIRLAEELSGTKIDAIYCSSSARCRQTLDEILRLRDDLMPIHISKLVGPKLKKEGFEQLQRRIEIFVDDLKYEHTTEETILIISHQMPLRMMVYMTQKKDKRFENAELFQIIL